jgi:hypothetical protein
MEVEYLCICVFFSDNFPNYPKWVYLLYMQHGNCHLENELDELAKLYFKEFPALDSKITRRKVSPKLRTKNENKSINRESKQLKLCDYLSHNGGTFPKRDYHFKGGSCSEDRSRKQYRKVKNYTRHEEWSMDFEGTWEMGQVSTIFTYSTKTQMSLPLCYSILYKGISI